MRINPDELRRIAANLEVERALKIPPPYDVYSMYGNDGHRVIVIECICSWHYGLNEIEVTSARIDIQQATWEKHYHQCKIAQVVLGNSTEPLDPTWGS